MNEIKNMEPIELLDRMLNRTTLSTQRVLHNHIMGYYII